MRVPVSVQLCAISRKHDVAVVERVFGCKVVKGLAIQGSRTAESEQTVAEWARKNIR